MSNSVRPHRQPPTRLLCPWDSPGKNTGVDCHFLLQCMKVKSESEVTQSCPTLCDPMDCSPPGSSVHGILQASILEWVAMPFSKGLPRLRDRTQVSCTAGGCFTTELPGKPTYRSKSPNKRKMKYLMRHSSFQKEGHSLITSRATETHQETAR